MIPDTKRRLATISLLAALLTVGMLGAFATPAAAVSVDNFDTNPAPADVPTGSEDVDQNLTSTGPLELTTSGGINESVAIEYDLSTTPLADALTEDTTLSVSSNTNATVGYKDVVPEDEIATFTIDTNNASKSGNPANVSVTATLEGLDTSSLSTDTNLDYRITTSSDQVFTSEPIAADKIDRATFSPEFNLAFVEVNDLDNNDDVVVTSIAAAFDQSTIDAQGNNDVDLDNDIRIDVGGGDYTFDNVTVENDSMTLQPVEGEDVRFIHNGTSSPFFNVSTTGGKDISGVTFQGVTMDFDTQTNATGIAVNGGSGGVDDVTIDGVTFEAAVDAQNGTTAVDINSTAGGTDGVTITDSTFDAAPDADDVVRPATAINVSDSATDLKLTVENNNFDGFDESINVSTALDEATITGNSFSTGNTYVETASQLNLDSIYNNNDFGAFAIEQDSSGDIQTAIYGNLTQGIVDGTINASADDRVLIAGEHTGVSEDISVNGNSTTVTSPDGRDATIAGSGFNGALINVTKFDGNPIDDVTVSDLTLQPASDTDGIQLNGTDSTVDYQDITLTGSTFELKSGSIGINSTGTQDLIEAEISDNNFKRADSETNYTAAIDLGSFELDDDGDVVSVGITDNEIDNADNGIEVVANDENDDNLELDVSNNAISLVEAGGDGINVTATSVKEVVIGGTNDGNTIIGSSDGTDATAILIDGSVDDKVAVTDNEIEGISTSNNNAGTAIDIDGFGSSAVTIENNELVDNAVQINASDTGAFEVANGEIVDLVSSQTTVQNDVRVYTAASDGSNNRVDDLNTDVVFGAINATIAQANPGSNDVVSVGEGTYEETQIEANTGTRIESAGSAENTVLTSDSGNRFINVSAGVTIDGFAFESTDDSDAGDIEIQDLSSGAVTIQNSIFVGPGTENRKGILISSNENNDHTVKIEDNEFTSYRAAVDVQQHGDSDLHVVRNTLSDNDRAVRIADSISHDGNGEAAINFNDITSNSVGLEVGSVSYTHVNATASWWGDDTGPSGDEGDVNEFVGEGDEIIDNYDNGGTNASIYLQESTTNLPDSGYVVVDDPSDVRANGNEEAFITVATLDDGEASDEAAGNTNLLFPDTAGGVLSKSVQYGDSSVNASDPLVYNLTTDDAGEYLVRAQHDSGDVAQGEATQLFTGEISDVVVTADSDTLVADGETTVNITAQLSDGERDITLADQDMNFLLDTTGIDNANVTREAQDDQTDALGRAALTLSTTQAGGEITVTAQDDNTGSSGEVTIQTGVEETANFNITNVDGPTTIVQNQSYTVDATISNDGDASGTQTVSYELLAEGGVTPEVEKSSDVTIDAGSSQTVSFELTAEETNALETGAFEHVLGTDDDEETVGVEVTDAQEANFQLDLADGPTQVTQNESYSATVNVSNNGGASGTQTVDYALENDSTGDAAVTASQDVTVDAGATEQITFDVAASDTQSIAAGEYTHVVSTDGADDATLGVTITVEEDAGDVPEGFPGNASQFNAIDADGDGALSPIEIAQAITDNAEQGDVNGVEISPIEIAEIITFNSEQ